MMSSSSDRHDLASICFGGGRVLVRAVEEQGRALLRFLFAPHLSRPDRNDEGPADYGLVMNAGQLALFKQARMRYDGEIPGKLAATLMDGVMRDLADDCPDGLMLHAAALSRQGRGVLLPGVSGAGKSTLTTWFGSQGFNCLSDEMVFISNRDFKLDGFNRPIQLKRPLSAPIRQDVDDYLENHSQGDAYVENELGLLIRPEAIHPASSYASVDTDLIIFPEYRPNSEFSLQKLGPAQAALQLMSCLINARNLDGHGLGDASVLAKQVPAYRVVFSDLHDVRQEIIRLLQ